MVTQDSRFQSTYKNSSSWCVEFLKKSGQGKRQNGSLCNITRAFKQLQCNNLGKSNLFALSLPFFLLLFFHGYTKNSRRLTMSSHFGDEEYRSAATLFQSFVFFNLCNPLIYVNTQLLWQHFILHMDAYNILQMQRRFYFTHDYVQSLHSLMIIALSKHKQRNSFKTFLHHLLICYRNWCICYKMLDLEKATRERI